MNTGLPVHSSLKCDTSRALATNYTRSSATAEKQRVSCPHGGEVKREETRAMGLSSSEDPMIVA